MKHIDHARAVICALAFVGSLSAMAAPSTINSVNRFAYGANIGWIDWRGDVTSGAVIGAFVCSGYIWGANVGWIDLGDGTPANGIHYQNNSATDFGVNHDGAGNLRGHAYAANIGWLTFTNRDVNGATYDGPKVDLLTGRLSGFVWSANCGWISLSNQFAFVQTDTMSLGPDTDGDGIPDAWELQFAPNLTVLDGGSDNDGDGFTSLEEFVADTNPLDPNSLLRLTLIAAAPGGSPANLTWASRPTRVYRIRGSADLSMSQPWPDVSLGLLAPDPGDTTTRTVTGINLQRFFVIEALMPLNP